MSAIPAARAAGAPALLLGLPRLAEGPLWRAVLRLGAPVLVSANALSRWRTSPQGERLWCGFARTGLDLVARHPVALDSAGFVAISRYGAHPWSVPDYLHLAASAPFTWWAAMDLCMEQEVRGDEDDARDRISATVRLNTLCLTGGAARNIAHNFLPVLQGWRPDHYLRCLDRMPWAAGFPLLGIGSTCRRHALGRDGVIAIVEALDDALPPGVRLHLFGVKGQALAVLRGHPRIASADSSAFSFAARMDALRRGTPKPDAAVAGAMVGWWTRHQALLSEPGWRMPPAAEPPAPPQDPSCRIERDVAAAREEMRQLHEAGEIDWETLSPMTAFTWAFMDDTDEDGTDLQDWRSGEGENESDEMRIGG